MPWPLSFCVGLLRSAWLSIRFAVAPDSKLRIFQQGRAAARPDERALAIAYAQGIDEGERRELNRLMCAVKDGVFHGPGTDDV